MQSRLTARRNKSLSYTLISPIKGLNVRDSLTDMDAGCAITMDNYIPLDTKVALRKGYKLYAAFESDVSTLATYNAGTHSRFFAISGHQFRCECQRVFGDNVGGRSLPDGTIQKLFVFCERH